MDWQTALDLYLFEQEALGRSAATLEWHRAQLPRFIRWCQEQGLTSPLQLTPQHPLAYALHLRTAINPKTRQPYAPGGVATSLRSVKAWLNYLSNEGAAALGVARKLSTQPPQKVPDPFSDDEVTRMRRAVISKGGLTGIQDRALLEFLLDTGCRVGEVCSLDLANVDLRNRCCLVAGKTGQRLVVFGPRCETLLRRWLQDHPEHPALFLSQRGRWTRNGLLLWCQRLGAKAGVADVHPHRFRATCATRIAATGHLFAAQQQLGHRSLEMTRLYASVNLEALRSAHAQAFPRR